MPKTIRAVIVADRSVSGPGCNWRLYVPVEKGTFAHTEGPFIATQEQGEQYCRDHGYEFEVRW